jgi:hypothetical protein
MWATWPLGLFLIGLQILLFSTTSIYAESSLPAFIFAGGRMLAMALIGLKLGYLNKNRRVINTSAQTLAARGWKESRHYYLKYIRGFA